MPASTDCGEVCENAARELDYRIGEPFSGLYLAPTWCRTALLYYAQVA